MAIVVRYFSTAAAGAGDGTTWADRAQLVSGATWSTVITGFSFAGSDSLECRIGAGTHSPTAAMASALFANPPSLANAILFHGCDSSGNALEPADPGWVSAQGVFDDSAFPVIATTTNIATSSLTNAAWRCVKFTASGRNGAILTSAGAFDWCSVTSTTANTAAIALAFPVAVTNCQILMNSVSWDMALQGPAASANISNVRINGSAGVTSGTRRGISTADVGHNVSRVTIIGCAGGGVLAAAGAVSRLSVYSSCTIVNCGSYGIQCNSTASQTARHNITNCYLSGNTYGIDANGSHTIAVNNRLRDSTSGNFANFGNYSTAYNYTTDSDDATEFVNSGAGDYRIKNTATAVWGKGYGAGDEAAAGGGGRRWGPPSRRRRQ